MQQVKRMQSIHMNKSEKVSKAKKYNSTDVKEKPK